MIECLIAALAFYIFLVHSLSAREPFLNLKLLTDRNYAIGLVLVTIYGMLNFTPMVLLPPLLQQQAGYPDALVGQVIGCRGVGMLVGSRSGCPCSSFSCYPTSMPTPRLPITCPTSASGKPACCCSSGGSNTIGVKFNMP